MLTQEQAEAVAQKRAEAMDVLIERLEALPQNGTRDSLLASIRESKAAILANPDTSLPDTILAQYGL